MGMADEYLRYHQITGLVLSGSITQTFWHVTLKKVYKYFFSVFVTIQAMANWLSFAV